MFEIVCQEVLLQNLDASLVMLTVMREEFNELKLKDVYEMLIMMPKLNETDELNLMFV